MSAPVDIHLGAPSPRFSLNRSSVGRPVIEPSLPNGLCLCFPRLPRVPLPFSFLALFLFSVLDVPTHGGFCVPTCSSRGRNSAWSFELLLLLLLLSRGPTSIRRGVPFLFAVFSCERLCKDLRGFRLSPRFGDLPSSYPRRPLLAAALFTRCEAGARDSQWRSSGDRAGPRRAEPERWRGGRLSSRRGAAQALYSWEVGARLPAERRRGAVRVRVLWGDPQALPGSCRDAGRVRQTCGPASPRQ